MIQQLDFLWESGDPHTAIQERFGWHDLNHAEHVISDLVQLHYDEQIQAFYRLSISAINLIAWIETTHGRRIWKAAGHPYVHKRAINATNLHAWIGTHDIPVAQIIPTTAGAYQPIADNLAFSLHAWLNGNHLQSHSTKQLQQTGAIVAQIQQTLKAYPHAGLYPKQQQPRWISDALDRLPAWCATRHDAHTWQALIARLHAINWCGLPQGLAHNDVRAANVLFKDGKLQAVLDWEDVGWNVYVVELAWTMVYGGTLYRDWRPLNKVQQNAILAGYQSVRPLDVAEQVILPSLLQVLAGDFARTWNLTLEDKIG